MKFLVTWQLELALLSRDMGAAIARVPAYAAELERRGKVVARYHIVGAHGGVWISYTSYAHGRPLRLNNKTASW